MEQKGKESRKTGTERHNLSSLLTKGELIFLFFFLSFSPLFPLKPQKSSLVSANRVSLKPSHRTVSPTRKSLKISELETLDKYVFYFALKYTLQVYNIMFCCTSSQAMKQKNQRPCLQCFLCIQLSPSLSESLDPCFLLGCAAHACCTILNHYICLRTKQTCGRAFKYTAANI